jgi:Tfp pilus assembly PilM family ATPase
MFAGKDTLLGLEVNEDHLLLVEITGKNGSYQLQHAVWDDLPPHTVRDGKVEDVGLLAERIHDAWRKHRFQGRMVNLVVPSQYVLLRQMQLPDLDRKEMEKLVRMELDAQVHLPFDDPVIDFVVEQTAVAAAAEPVSAGKRKKWWNRTLSVSSAAETRPLVDVTIVAAPREVIAGYTAAAKKAGLIPKRVDIRALSIARVMQKMAQHPLPETILAVDVSYHSTDIHIFSQGWLRFTRNLPLSLSAFRLEHGLPSDPTLHFIERIEHETDYAAFAKELAFEIDRSANFFQYTLNNRSVKVDQVVLSGFLPFDGRLTRLLQERLEFSVEEIPLRRLTFPADRTPVKEALYPFSVAIGLALKEVNGHGN